MKKQRPRILTAFDFSEASRAALTEATRMALTTGAELVLLHVFAQRNPTAEYGWKGGATQREHERRDLFELLEHEAEVARTVQVIARVRTAVGEPAQQILEAAALEDAAAIFLGADAHEGFAGMLLGRVALQVVREADAPVFVVRRRAAASPTDILRGRRIVAGFDFTSASRAAVDSAVALAKHAGGEVRIVHVIPTAHSVDAEEMSRLRSRLEELAAEARTNGVVASALLTFGDPATALIAETEHEPGSVIAVGARPRSRVARLLLGDVTESLLRVTDATVMVAHAGPVSSPLVALPLLGSPPPAAQERRRT